MYAYNYNMICNALVITAVGGGSGAVGSTVARPTAAPGSPLAVKRDVSAALTCTCQLSCLGSSAGRALCLECRVSLVRIPLDAAHFSLEK